MTATAPQPVAGPPVLRRVVVEVVAAGVALALAVLVSAHLADVPRAWLLYDDGDSMLPALLRGSLSAGQRQDWALSSVLFVPEAGVYLGLSAWGLSVHDAFTVNGLLNWLAFFAALRYLVGASGNARAALAALGGFAAYACLALLESSGNRESLENASLLSTTTYYSATIVGVLLSIGLVVRALSADSRRRRSQLLVTLAVVVAASTFTNPIFLVWGAPPLAVVLVVAAGQRWVTPRAAATIGAAGLAAAAVGLVARLPLNGIIKKDAVSIFQPAHALESARYYGGLLTDLAGTPAGVLELVLLGALLLLSVGVSVVALRRRDVLAAAISLAAWVAPAVLLVIVIASGTFSPRYLQAMFFLPLLAFAALARMSRVSAPISPHVRRAGVLIPVLMMILAVAIAPTALPQPSRAGASDQRDVSCVTDWVTASHRIGAGEYWTIRTPKAYLVDPAQLLQTDERLDPYLWLVNQADFDNVRRVSFVVSSDDSAPLILPPTVAGMHADVIECGRYTITDFGAAVLSLGKPHS